jgi:hypothetical protein
MANIFGALVETEILLVRLLDPLETKPTSDEFRNLLGKVRESMDYLRIHPIQESSGTLDGRD